MRKAFILFTLLALFGFVFTGCSSSTGGSSDDEKKSSTSTEQPKTPETTTETKEKPVVKISSNEDIAFSGKDLVFDLVFEKYDSNPTSVDVFIENNSIVYAANLSVNSNKVTVTVPANFTEKTIGFYIKAGGVESNHISLKYGYSVTVDELEDFINSLTTTDVVLLRVTGSFADFKNKTDVFKNENLRINLDISTINNLAIEDSLFRECKSIYTLNIPDGITCIGKGAFAGCSNLNNINLPETIVEIKENAFFVCSNLTEINLPREITRIEKYTFMSCSKLKEVVIPANVSYIGEHAFESCRSLESLILSNKITSIEPYVFDGCQKLKIDIPEGVKEIKEGAFDGCYRMNSVILPNSLEKIGKKAFSSVWLTNNGNLTIPAKVSYIDSYAFYNAKCLRNVVFENPTGWKAGDVEISEEDLNSKALQYLRETYLASVWTRTTE